MTSGTVSVKTLNKKRTDNWRKEGQASIEKERHTILKYLGTLLWSRNYKKLVL